jgi:2-desacetyl-2-hydroxyethyl bacteriochlorophyllide A dehydrogenase
MERRTIYFVGPGQIEVRSELMPALRANELLVRTELSAISAGTEMLLYRDELPVDVEAQDDAFSRALRYPCAYGYSAVGRVVDSGTLVDSHWRGRLVFGFQAHSSHFTATADELLPVPEGLAAADAAFLPNMETAVNLVQDAAPLIGERALVLGQGVVGLLTAALLLEFPLGCLVTADRCEGRRRASSETGVSRVLDPDQASFREDALEATGALRRGYDLTIDLTGAPSALNDALALTGFDGRVVVGSWYGNKKAPIDLGGKFHRSRIKLIASQVSTIAPALSGRWDKARRFAVAWDALRRIQPSRWITHRFPLECAAQAYELIDRSAEGVIQVVFDYS